MDMINQEHADQAAAQRETICFVNCCTYTKENVLAMHRIARPRIVIALFWLLVVVMPPLIVLELAAHQWSMAIVLASLLTLLVFLQAVAPRLRVKQYMEQMQAMNGAPSQVETVFTQQSIRSHNLMSGAKSELSYAQLVRIVRTQELYLLQLRPQLYVLVDRGGFLQGRDLDFEDFIRERAPQAKLQVRR